MRNENLVTHIYDNIISPKLHEESDSDDRKEICDEVLKAMGISNKEFLVSFLKWHRGYYVEQRSKELKESYKKAGGIFSTIAETPEQLYDKYIDHLNSLKKP